MPQLTDITIKKADGTTNVTYSGVVAAAGDKQPAVFRDSSSSLAPAFQPTFEAKGMLNGPRTARRIEGKFTYPVTVTGTDGAVKLVGTFPIKYDVTVPQNLPAAVAEEAAAQFGNLMASSLVKAMNASGYAAT